ncbi:T9SS C-terminal target domain-containing protein [Lacihabitans sp. LS3-19]|uniref:T9SS type A sorting domain-containing protein n=1 Tax=Lacihabitans sp. LS3-19 TaxID=2487335 RepID=UPI0020CE8A19|nr:T9SS type A sorting domain-containing protein [Lacihabitans sp. LS3-19]MCP9770945.1 T9SS C-terminal target domain-containing protein [Lacihabitans sp. LS3-19]
MTVAFLASSIVFAQKDESRLNIGQSPKKTTVSNSILSKGTNLPKSISYNSKNNYTLFYRNLLLNTKTNQVDSKVVSNQTQEAESEVIKLSNIYPNPASSFAYIDYSINGSFNSANISFFNLLGKQVAEYPLSKYSDKLKVGTSTWESGIYMYQLIIDGKKISTKKLLVRHN